MSKKSINELELKSQPVAEIDYANLPEEFSSAPPPPYPGTYRFKLPGKDSLAVVWQTFDSKNADGGDGPQCVTAVFDKDDPLVITGGSEKVGEPFTCRINNRPRNRARKGEPEMLVSDGTYLLRALDPTKKVKNYDNKGFITAVVAQGGKEFVADVEWSTYCSDQKQAYYEDESGNLQPWVDEDGGEHMGCGERYYMNNWVRGEDGKYKPRLVCKCGASLRPFAGLRQFKTAK